MGRLSWFWDRINIKHRITLTLFHDSVLKEDANEGVASFKAEILRDLRSKVFYNANWIYSQILVDIELMPVSPTLIRRILIKFLARPRAILRSLGILICPKRLS